MAVSNHDILAALEAMGAHFNRRMDGFDAKLDQTNARIDQTNARLDEVIATQAVHGKRLDGIEARIYAADCDLREIKGPQSIILIWFQSMDQRFGALMAPVTPPRAGGAKG